MSATNPLTWKQLYVGAKWNESDDTTLFTVVAELQHDKVYDIFWNLNV